MTEGKKEIYFEKGKVIYKPMTEENHNFDKPVYYYITKPKDEQGG